VGKKIFLFTFGMVILFYCITIISAVIDSDSGLAWIKESFEWISVYVLPWIIVILLYLILKKLDRK